VLTVGINPLYIGLWRESTKNCSEDCVEDGEQEPPKGAAEEEGAVNAQCHQTQEEQGCHQGAEKTEDDGCGAHGF